jgi:hypothetical protein
MIRTVLAAATAAALVFAPPLARPAGAETGEALGLLLGIGLVHALGKGIERARDPAPEAALLPERITPERITDRKSWAGRDHGQRILPRECLATHQTWHGEIRGFGARCLRDRMRRPDRLPGLCALHTRVGGRDRTIYSARCLQIEGWEIARAGRDDPWQRPRPGYGPGWSRP